MRRVLTWGSSWGLACPSPILTRLKWRKLTHVRCLLSVPATCLMLYVSFSFTSQSSPTRWVLGISLFYEYESRVTLK